MRHRFCLNFWFGVPKYKKEHERVRGWKRRRRRARERSSKTGQQEKASQANGARNFGAPRPMRSPFARFLCAALAENPTTDAPRRVTKLQGENWGTKGRNSQTTKRTFSERELVQELRKKNFFVVVAKNEVVVFLPLLNSLLLIS